MAKEATSKEQAERRPDENDKRGTQYGNTRQRDEDEAKDRERLRAERAELTPEKIGELQTELATLKTRFAADITKLREDFNEKKAELEQQISAGSTGYAPLPAGGLPTNETLADGSSRRSITIPINA